MCERELGRRGTETGEDLKVSSGQRQEAGSLFARRQSGKGSDRDHQTAGCTICSGTGTSPHVVIDTVRGERACMCATGARLFRTLAAEMDRRCVIEK